MNRSLKRRINNLSRLIDIKNKQLKRKNKYYFHLSEATKSASQWLESPKNSTLLDLRTYFDELTLNFINGTIGNVGDTNIYLRLLQTNHQKSAWTVLSSISNKTFDFLERLVKLSKEIVSL